MPDLDLSRVRIDGAHTVSVLGSCREVHGPASPELEPTLETLRLTSEALNIGPFDLSSGGETHECNSALSDHTQIVLIGKEVGIDVHPMNRLSNLAGGLIFTDEQRFVLSGARSRRWFVARVARFYSV
jgi:hypothetical protein